jgi:nitrogen fixation protein
MSHLDFSAFVASNPDLGNTYYIWNGGTFDAFAGDGTVNTTEWTDASVFIAPMQSFIAQKNGNVKIESVNISPEMSVVSPGSVLRNSNATRDDIFRIEVSRNDKRESAVTFIYREGTSNAYDKSKDAPTLFSNTVTQPAVLYSPVDGHATSIRTLGDLSVPIPLDIRTTSTGELKLSLKASEDAFDVQLKDLQSPEPYDLNTSDFVFYNETGNVSGRFYLYVTPATTDLNNRQITDPIVIRTNNNQVSILSPREDPIISVQVTDMTGKTILSNFSVNKSEYEFSLPSDVRLAVIKVFTNHSRKIEKIILSNK